MANTHPAYPGLAIGKFCGTDPDQDAETFIQLIERKMNSALGDAPADAGELANYTFGRKALFFSLLRRPATAWCENNITNATSWENVRTKFTARFSDGWNNFQYRMEGEHCIRGDGVFWNFLHLIERTVDKERPDDIEGIAPSERPLKHGRDDKDILTTQWNDLGKDIYNEKHKNTWWETLRLRGTVSQPE